MSSVTPLVLFDKQQEVVEILVATGLSAADFRWVSVDSSYRDDGHIASRIEQLRGDYFCKIDRKPNGSWVIDFCPGDDIWTGHYESHWTNIISQIKQWAGYAARELNAKDYLVAVMSTPSLTALPLSDVDSTPFDDQEKAVIRERLNRIEEHVMTLSDGTEQFAREVRGHFEFLHTQVERSDRRAFFYSMFGTMVTVGTTYIGTEGTRRLLNFVAQQFGPILPHLTQLISS
jgi:hypothetical protein